MVVGSRSWLLRFAAIVLLLGPTLARGAEVIPLTQVEPAALVSRLGDESFGVREEAARELSRRGLVVQSALEEGAALGQGDLEIRLRCQELLKSLLRGDLEKRLAAFIADTEGKQTHRLPGWDRYRKTCGTSRAARELFAEIMRSETALLETLDAQPAQLGQIFSERVDALQNIYYSGSRDQISPATVAALLLVGIDPGVTIDAQTGFIMHNFLLQQNTAQALAEGPRSESLLVLLEGWIGRGSQETLGYYNLSLALRYNLKNTGLVLGRKILAMPGASTNSLQQALISVGRFGGKDDRPLLEAHLKNNTTCHTWSNPQFKNLIKTEIRDVALVMLLHVTAQEPKDFGFVLLQSNPMTVYHIYSFGFHEPADRDMAFAKWNEWAAANAK